MLVSFHDVFRCFNTTLAIPVLLLCVAFPIASATPQLNVLVPYFPPYTHETNHEISGLGIDLANKVFKQAGISVRYRLFPNYAKALHEMEQGRGDAVLLASQNTERDNIAVLTKPLIINYWCWYLLKSNALTPFDDNFKQKAKISSHFKTNTHKWLIENNYTVEPAMQVLNLPQLLIRGRVDAVFIAELAFEEALKQNNLNLKQFKKYIALEKPFGIYLSKTYLAKNPEMLQKINHAIETVIVDL